MEAPEIIWLSPNEYRSNEPSCFWSESQRTDYDIEYIRKDAFIRKARKYFIKELPNFRSFMESGTAFIKNFESFIQEE